MLLLQAEHHREALRPAFRPAGTGGYEDLAQGAIRFEVFGVDLLAASLADIVRSKEATDRPQDRQDVVVLREMIRRGGRTEPG